MITEYVAETDKAKFGPRFKKDWKAVETVIEQLTQDVKEKLSLKLKEDGKISIEVPRLGDGQAELTSDLVKFEQRTRKEYVREYTPAWSSHHSTLAGSYAVSASKSSG